MKKSLFIFAALVCAVSFRVDAAEVFGEQCGHSVTSLEVGSHGTIKLMTRHQEKAATFEISSAEAEKNAKLLPVLIAATTAQTEICLGRENGKVVAVKLKSPGGVYRATAAESSREVQQREFGRPSDK